MMDATTTLGIGGAIAILVAIVKMAFPALPSRMVPVLVLVLAAGLVVLEAASTGDRDALAIVMQVVIQAASALGLREGLVTAVPRASALGGPSLTGRAP